MKADWYSLRMRATCCGRHLSGAERISRVEDIPALTAALTERAMSHSARIPDEVHCTVERLDASEILHAELPDITTWDVPAWQAGRELAGRLLKNAGVAAHVVSRSLACLAEGPAPDGGVMRGAMVVDRLSGERLEPDRLRGVRVSRMDVAPDGRAALEQLLNEVGLGHHRVLEALVLTGKVLKAPGIVAELCWSDAPDYVTGYVASPIEGYQRITRLKEAGDPMGGRIFFIDRRNWDRDEFIAFLEQRGVLFHGKPGINPTRTWRV